jgi:sialate O-acetylesterase
VTIDIGIPDNVHPTNKQDVGARLALAARAIAYGESIEYSGPAYRTAAPQESGLRVLFDHSKGMTAKGGELKGFEIAGADKKFALAKAVIDGESIVVSSSGVTTPVFVRYSWADVPDGNLYNAAGLPASPFTSEP